MMWKGARRAYSLHVARQTMYGKLVIGTGGTGCTGGTGGTCGTYVTMRKQKLPAYGCTYDKFSSSFIRVGRRQQNKQPRGTCITPSALPGDISLLGSGRWGFDAAVAVTIVFAGELSPKGSSTWQQLRPCFCVLSTSQLNVKRLLYSCSLYILSYL